MAIRTFDYQKMNQESMREFVKKVLQVVVKNGLPGDHHFYITFQTDRPDVELPSYLIKKHPEEITVVLQHQFWDLKVFDKYFEVSLSFNDVLEKIIVPFSALINFLDPSVDFNLEFTPCAPETSILSKSKSGKKKSAKEGSVINNVVEIDFSRKKS